MVSPEILDYVKKELARGVSESQLRQVLMEHGWPEFEINEAFEKTKEEAPKETVEKKPKEVKKEKPFKEFLEGLGKKEPKEKEESKPEVKAEEKPPVMEDVKKIVTNKIFIIAAIVIILGSVAYFAIIPSFFEDTGESEESGAVAYAKQMCTQYCNSNLCGLVNDPGFTHPELEGKNCADIGFPCLLPSGQPKCETEY